jgi:hypothetical protein
MRSAWVTRLARVVSKPGSVVATSMMSPSGGTSTLDITWMTPLVACTFCTVTGVAVDVGDAVDLGDRQLDTGDGLDGAFGQLIEVVLAGDHVVREHGCQGGRVAGDGLDDGGGQCLEGGSAGRTR